MNRKTLAWALCLTAAFAIGCGSMKARRELADGKQDYRKGNFESAAKHFQTAVALDNDWQGAKFALAGAYIAEWAPDPETGDEGLAQRNRRHAQDAIDLFNQILKKDPGNAAALKDLAILSAEMWRLEDALSYGRKAIAAAPDDPDLYYLLGVVDWLGAYQNIRVHKTEIGLGMNQSPSYSGDRRRLCAQIRSDNEAGINDGLAMLEKAMAITHDYDDAMAYSSLLYQLKAETECENAQARSDDLRLSQKWIVESISARKRKAENPQPSPHNDFAAGLEEGKIDLLILPPAPPPPPPPSRKQAKR